MIREFKETDIDSVMTLWLQANTTAHGFIKEEYWEKNFPSVKEILPQSKVFVFEEQGEIKGFVGLMGNYIAGIFVSPSDQSRGIGKELLKYIKGKRGELSLHVYEKNDRAVSFYKGEGFSIFAHRLDDKTGEIEIEMTWKK